MWTEGISARLKAKCARYSAVQLLIKATRRAMAMIIMLLILISLVRAIKVGRAHRSRNYPCNCTSTNHGTTPRTLASAGNFSVASTRRLSASPGANQH